MPRKSCGGCRFYAERNKHTGECRRRALQSATWSTVSSTDWCGEWQGPEHYCAECRDDISATYQPGEMFCSDQCQTLWAAKNLRDEEKAP